MEGIYWRQAKGVARVVVDQETLGEYEGCWWWREETQVNKQKRESRGGWEGGQIAEKMRERDRDDPCKNGLSLSSEGYNCHFTNNWPGRKFAAFTITVARENYSFTRAAMGRL